MLRCDNMYTLYTSHAMDSDECGHALLIVAKHSAVVNLWKISLYERVCGLNLMKTKLINSKFLYVCVDSIVKGSLDKYTETIWSLC